MDSQTARATALLAGNGVSLLKTMDYLAAHHAHSWLQVAAELWWPVLGLLAAYIVLCSEKRGIFWEGMSLGAIVWQLILWCYTVVG